MNEEEIRAAKDALSEQTKRYQRADDTRTAARNAAIELALKLLDAKVGPSEVARLSPFTDSYIRKAARKAGLPPVTSPRGATAKRDH